MKTRGLSFVALAILLVSALSAAVASAQDGAQGTQSDDVAMPIDVTGSSPTKIEANFDTGTTQIDTFMPGQTNTNSTPQTAEPQRNQPRERRERKNREDATPTQAAPSGGDSANPGGSGLSDSSGGSLKELPRTGGPVNTGG